jgi:hypothetical protein
MINSIMAPSLAAVLTWIDGTICLHTVADRLRKNPIVPRSSNFSIQSGDYTRGDCFIQTKAVKGVRASSTARVHGWAKRKLDLRVANGNQALSHQ